MSGLPPWEAHGQRERKLMVDWVNSELDRISREDFVHKQATFFTRPDGTFNVEKYLASRWEYGPEIDAAEHGNIEPLRRCLSSFNPLIAKFVNLPRRKRGKRFPKAWKDKLQSPKLRQAVVEDVRRIRQLWQKHYGKKNRHADDGPSAEEIAATRWEVKVRNIVQWLKKSPAK
jgi:hypothetical protein